MDNENNIHQGVSLSQTLTYIYIGVEIKLVNYLTSTNTLLTLVSSAFCKVSKKENSPVISLRWYPRNLCCRQMPVFWIKFINSWYCICKIEEYCQWQRKYERERERERESSGGVLCFSFILITPRISSAT